MEHGIDLEVIVVDNASSDRTAESIAVEFPQVEVIQASTNLGFPKANNLGFAQATGEFILALNPDTVVHEGSLYACVNFLRQNPDYGCVGVKTLLPDGKIQYQCARQFPSLRSFGFSLFFMDKIFPRVQIFRSSDLPFWDHNDSRDVQLLQGSFMMFRKSIYDEIGGFDERIPMFLEDGEYCLRLFRNGYKIRYMSDVSITHHVGQSTAKSEPVWIAKLRYEANYLFLIDYQGRLSGFLYILFVLFGTPIKILLLPLFEIGLRIRKQNSRIKLYFWETTSGWIWLFDKFFHHPSAGSVRTQTLENSI